MAKNLKLNIKNEQIAQAINLSGLKSKLAKKNDATSQAPEAETPSSPITAELLEKPKSKTPSAKSSATSTKAHPQKIETASSDKLDSHEIKEEAPKIRARTRSAFAEPVAGEEKPLHLSEKPIEEIAPAIVETTSIFNITSEDTASDETQQRKTSEQLRKEIFGDELEIKETHQAPLLQSSHQKTKATDSLAAAQKENQFVKPPIKETPLFQPVKGSILKPSQPPVRVYTTPPMKLGPTGRHVNDLIPQRRPEPVVPEVKAAAIPSSTTKSVDSESNKARMKPKPRETTPLVVADDDKKGLKPAKFKEFKDIKPVKKEENTRFDGRDKSGLRDTEETTHWKKRKAKGSRYVQEDVTIRPTTLAVKIPIAIKDLAVEMKLKASQLIAKLFSQGLAVTLNDILEDETTIQLLGQEFGCDISIDTKEEKRIRITDKTIRDEIKETDPSLLTIRSPVVAFMGHVDHGKTSLIDAIRKTNRAEGEAGAITQHIGAFKCSTSVGDIAILDTPGHEAFSAMRARGADVTDIVVLVIAGDEGMRLQTIEALNHAKTAKVTIVVAINKCDKQNFNAENIYRQLSEQELLPEVWGGQTITINCSAVTGEGIQQLLEMLALQSEILEIKANKSARARGTVLESEMHKGMGPIATVLVQNGTLKIGDALVFGQLWGRVKTMQDEFRHDLLEAGPSTPVEITGLSGLPEAGQEFIVVKNEKEARNIAENRMLGIRQVNLLQTKKLSMDNLILQAAETNKKILNIVLRADVQGSLEALKVALMKIHSKKATLNIIYAGVGEVSESDVQLAAASKAVVIGFHTQIESHADSIVKEHCVVVKLHNIIYHAVDDVKVLMGNLLDKIPLETEKGKAEIRATFKSSQHGVIAGCIVIEGSIVRNNQVRLRREKEIIWKGSIASLKRVKEDVREVTKGIECGILLNGFYDTKEGDILEAYEITYITQEL